MFRVRMCNTPAVAATLVILRMDYGGIFDYEQFTCMYMQVLSWLKIGQNKVKLLVLVTSNKG